MFQDFWAKRRRLAALRRLFAQAGPALDPLRHPVLRAMSPAELADIPFPRPTAPSRPDRARANCC